MTIKVKVSTIDMNQIVAILEHYNSNKPPSYPPLEKLNRYESGFQIKIREKEFDKNCDANEKIKQLRWYKKQLIPHKGYPSFNRDEETLLLNAMKYVLSEENIEEICDDVNEKIKQLIEYQKFQLFNEEEKTLLLDAFK